MVKGHQFCGFHGHGCVITRSKNPQAVSKPSFKAFEAPEAILCGKGSSILWFSQQRLRENQKSEHHSSNIQPSCQQTKF